jgi:23S rRNA (adenine2503-C2)-methyltransferase
MREGPAEGFPRSSVHFMPGISDTSSPPTDLLALSQAEMRDLLTGNGFEGYRARQLYQWVFRRGAESFEEMSNLPKALTAWLSDHARLTPLRLLATEGPEDGTRKVLFGLEDGRRIESVLMRDDEAGWTSLCLSSQVGCAMKCSFCLTGRGGYGRDLTVAEIAGQAVMVRRRLMAEGEILHRIVFMGMGEPLLNLDGVIPAIRLLSDPDGFGVSRRRVTVSTCGIPAGIESLGRAKLGVGLAVSLNAPTDAVRSRIMPVNRKWPIADLMAALGRYPLEPRRRLTIEYALLKGVNDAPEDARRLCELLRGLPCKVNLIMFNPSPELPYEPVDEASLNGFAQILSKARLTVTVRWSKGREIKAACGQLAGHFTEPTHAKP